MSEEGRLLDALRRMQDTALSPDDGSEISAVVQRVAQRRQRIQGELSEMARDLDKVAALLRRLTDLPPQFAEQAREEIAIDFAAGALAVERARLSLDMATNDLEYLRYTLL